jgi:hypothetical protein
MTIYKLGYTPDRHGLRSLAKSSRALLGVTTPPKGASMQQYEYLILDQNNSGSCTGHGTAQALYTSYGAAARPLPFCPSPRVLYATVRMLELQSSSELLTDSGAMPTDLITVVNKWGISPMKAPTPDGYNSDVWSGNVNNKVTLLDLETSGLALQVEPHRVDETASDFATQLQLSIYADTAAGVGIFVDTMNFMSYDGSAPVWKINRSDPNGGDHWIAVTYYYTDSTNRLIFGGPNSWGTGYGKAGHWEMTADCLQSVCSDCLLFPVSTP